MAAKRRSGAGAHGGWWRRAAKGVALCLGLAAALPVLAILLFTVVDPPVSAYMMQRALAGHDIDQEWVDLDDISENLIRAVVASEDARFCSHSGIDWVELEQVIDDAQDDPDGPLRGASTITMQTAKNMFLWPGQSYLRKAIELPLAFVFDLVLSKRRILEIYLNIVEWAPGVYGAEAASRHHFGRDADAISRDQAALLAAVLPNPIARNASRPGRTTQRVAARVRRLMGSIDPYLSCLDL